MPSCPPQANRRDVAKLKDWTAHDAAPLAFAAVLVFAMLPLYGVFRSGVATRPVAQVGPS